MVIPMIAVMHDLNLALRFSDKYILQEELFNRNLRTIVEYYKK